MSTTPQGVAAAGRQARSRSLSGPAWLVASAALLAATVVLLIHAGRGTTFYSDDWAIVTSRADWDADALLAPHNEHLMALPVLVYKLLLSTVGLADYWPYRIPVLATHLVAVVLLFTIARRRFGPVVAAAAMLPLVAFGAAWEVTLWGLNIGFAGSVAAGLGALLCLDRGDRRGDVAASVLLVLSVASSSLGLCLALGVVVELLWRRGATRRLWVPGAPLLLYGAWFLAYHDQRHLQGPLEYGDALWFAVRAAVAAVGGYLGVGNTHFGELRSDAARVCLGVLVVAGLAAGLWFVVRRGRLTPRVASVAVTLVAFWALLGVYRAWAGDPYVSRYIYPGAFLTVLLIIEIAPRGVPPRGVQGGLLAVAAVAAGLGLAWLDDGSSWFRGNNHALRAELGALDAARGHVADDFAPDPRRAAGLTAARYFAATDRFDSSPGETVQELLSDIEPARLLADGLLLRAEAEALRPVAYVGAGRRLIDAARGRPRPIEVRAAATAPVQTRAGCLALRRGSLDVTVPARGLVVRPANGGRASVGLARFAGLPPSGTGLVLGGPAWVHPPRDGATVPWRARVAATGPVSVC